MGASPAAASGSCRDDGPTLRRRLAFAKDESFGETGDRLVGGVAGVRAGKEDRADKEMKLAVMLPGFLLSWAVRLMIWLDQFTLLPASMIRPDPLFASLFVANLGSLGLCLLYTSDAADERSSVDLGGRRIIKKKKIDKIGRRHMKHTENDRTSIYTVKNRLRQNND